MLAELPDALPERGVLLVQIRPGRTTPSRQVRNEFLRNLTVVYEIRQAQLVSEDYYDRPWQALIQDSDLIQRVGKALQKIRDAGRHGAVLVRIIIQGIDNTAWRHEELEQYLAQLLASKGAAVSVIEVTGATTAEVWLFRPSADADPAVLQEHLDLTRYLAAYSVNTDHGQAIL